MKTYKIVGRTNSWIAQRDMKFNGKTEITISEGLTLSDAKRKMLDFYNEDYDVLYPNWGLVVANGHGTAGTDSDGLYYYEYDGRVYRIEEEM